MQNNVNHEQLSALLANSHSRVLALQGRQTALCSHKNHILQAAQQVHDQGYSLPPGASSVLGVAAMPVENRTKRPLPALPPSIDASLLEHSNAVAAQLEELEQRVRAMPLPDTPSDPEPLPTVPEEPERPIDASPPAFASQSAAERTARPLPKLVPLPAPTISPPRAALSQMPVVTSPMRSPPACSPAHKMLDSTIPEQAIIRPLLAHADSADTRPVSSLSPNPAFPVGPDSAKSAPNSSTSVHTPSTGAQTTPHQPDPPADKTLLRQAAIAEILTTEASYLSFLYTLCILFAVPLKDGTVVTSAPKMGDTGHPPLDLAVMNVGVEVTFPSESTCSTLGISAAARTAGSFHNSDKIPTLSTWEHDRLFNEITTILPLHVTLLQDLMNACSTVPKATPSTPTHKLSPTVLVPDPENAMIGKIFSRVAPFFRMYSRYCFGHATADSDLRARLEEYDRMDFTREELQSKSLLEFHEYVYLMESDPAIKGQNLASLLAMPIQRIPRYILLLQGM
jgi:hypothetical protein